MSRPRVDGSRAAPRGAVLKSGTRAAADSSSKSCEWGLLLRRETGRSTSRSAFVQVVGLAHYLRTGRMGLEQLHRELFKLPLALPVRVKGAAS